MESRTQDFRQRKSLCHYMLKLPEFIGGASCFTNVQFAISFSSTNPANISFDWLKNLSPGGWVKTIYFGACTAIVSGMFGYIYAKKAVTKLQEETALVRQGKNKKRYAAELASATAAGICGGAISGLNYKSIPALQWSAMTVGLVVNFQLALLGANSFIKGLTDEEEAMKNNVISAIDCQRDYINQLLKNKTLTPETQEMILNELTTIRSKMNADEIMSFQRKQKLTKILDTFIAGILTAGCCFIFLQSGFAGTNILSFNNLNDIHEAAKNAIGILIGSPMISFIFDTLKSYRSLINNLSQEIKLALSTLTVLGLTSLCVGNAAWFHGLARAIAGSENILPAVMESFFGQSLFPWTAMLACTIIASIGLELVFFPINKERPRAKDLIHSLQNEPINPAVMEGIKRYSLFTTTARPAIELQAVSTQEHDQLEVEELGITLTSK